MAIVSASSSQSFGFSYSNTFTFLSDEGGASFEASTQSSAGITSENTSAKNLEAGQNGRHRDKGVDQPVRQNRGLGHHHGHRDGLKHAMSVVEKALRHGYESLAAKMGSPSAPISSQNSAIQQYAAIADENPTADSIADRIIGFIGNKLQAISSNGGGQEELTQYLSAGLEGFEKGLAEAKDQLQATGMLDDDVESAIGKTYDLVMAGIEELRGQYLGEETSANPSANPAQENVLITAASEAAVVESTIEPEQLVQEEISPDASPITNSAPESNSVQPINNTITTAPEIIPNAADSVEAQLVDALSQPYGGYNLSVANNSYAYGSLNELDFQLTTRDGDVVTINFADTQAFVKQSEKVYGLSQDGFFSQHSMASAYYQNTEYSFSVDGELDDGELTAVTDLLKQVRKLASEFFEGDPQKAFDKALEMGYDSSEITEFSLNMTKIEVLEVSRSYAEIAQLDPETGEQTSIPSPPEATNPFLSLGKYVRDLMSAAEKASEFKDSRVLLIDAMRSVEKSSQLQLKAREDSPALAGFTHFNTGLLEALEI